jgi:hypothetical protein
VPGEIVVEGPGWRDTIALGTGHEGELRWEWVRREDGRPRRALGLRVAELRVGAERLAPANEGSSVEPGWVSGEWNGAGWRVAGGPVAPSSTAS